MGKKSLPFACKVKEVRKQLGCTQEDLAQKLGVSFATINRWENEKAAPSKLAQAQFGRFCSELEQKGISALFSGKPE